MKLNALFLLMFYLLPTSAHATEWIQIPAGSFIMGSSKAQIEQGYQISAQGYGNDGVRKMQWFDGEYPQHQESTAAFRIMKTPVTNAEYALFIQATGHAAPFVSPKLWISYHLGHPYQHVKPYLWQNNQPQQGKEDHPVVLVNFNDAKAYAAWLSKKIGRNLQLPTEKQWEKAMRGEDGKLYPWGNHYDPHLLNNNDLGHFGTTPVGSFPKGASEYGVLDGEGQVFEWTQTPWTKTKFTVKGGSWDDHGGVCRPAAHHGRPTVLKHILIGFRLVDNKL
ncbi:MAG: SUMF1/EgtB/PvdO family nonheme iron enzyme [Ghiorsea sp.]